MVRKNETVYTKDLDNKQMCVSRRFEAPVEIVWAAWTDPEILDKWWAPKPWKAVTKSMDFREGGTWLYCMQGPEGEKHWGRNDYHTIKPLESMTGVDGFCDEDGVVNPAIALTKWRTSFKSKEGSTLVDIVMTFNDAKDIQVMIDMGFEEGFRMAHDNLDELLSRK